eukprot:gnl/MRDRNA2_/MRDRNA2_98674_c0_seq1.p1 gnl/MRDRNA2_/MRDRNA2_98674_c0~~gnl/MRDRNA2_/MRDRNA2_98674_c0_seq1.p1  ORF type:complete len:614 (+),score=118.45 gnl/MRDRNA2_/MRDRNA2_98674_c0_seq1:88-1929(+)
MPFAGIRAMTQHTQPLRSERAAKQWRHQERGKILGEKNERCTFFQNLEKITSSIDHMIAVDKMKSKPKKRGPKLPDTPPSTPKARIIIQVDLPRRSPLQQRVQGERMSKGQRSDGEGSDVVEEVRCLTMMPQNKCLRPPSPRLNAPPKVTHSAEKRCSSRVSEASTRSATPEASYTTESIDSMSDASSVGEKTHMIDRLRPPSVRSEPPTELASRPGSAEPIFRKVPSDENSSNHTGPLPSSAPTSARSVSPIFRKPTSRPPPLMTARPPSAPPSACSKFLQVPPQHRVRRASEGDCRPASMGQRRDEVRRSSEAASEPLTPRRAEGRMKSSFDSSLGIIERIVEGKAISLERREACEAIRLFLFNSIGHEGIEAHHLSNYWKKKVFSDGEGTAKQCSLLYDFWSRVDPDFTWVTSIYQVQTYLHQVHPGKRSLGLKFVSFLVSREKNRFSVEDAMRIIWPGSFGIQLASMKALMAAEHEENKRKKAKTVAPPMLPEEEHEALTRIFKQLDTHETGRVSFQALEDMRDELHRPLVDSELVRSYAAIWDPEGTGFFGLETFLQMMCPAGFRVSAQSNVAVRSDGDRVCRSLSGAWYVSEGNERTGHQRSRPQTS